MPVNAYTVERHFTLRKERQILTIGLLEEHLHISVLYWLACLTAIPEVLGSIYGYRLEVFLGIVIFRVLNGSTQPLEDNWAAI